MFGSFLLVINAEVAILADTFSIQGSVYMFALKGFLGSTLGVVAVLAHAVSIVGHVVVAALGDLVAVLLLLAYGLGLLN